MYLGIDLGTSEVKALVIDENHEVIASHSAPLSIQRPHPHWSEQAPELWWEATEYLMATLREKCAQHWPAIKAIGLSGQMHGAVLLDAEGKAIRPAILWNDTRCAAECAELEAMAPELHQVAGNLAMPGFTAPKLLWVRRHEPQHFQRTATVLLPKDYLRYRMTGKKVSDMSDAAGTLWLDVAKRDWSDALLDKCGLSRSQMPKLVEGCEVSATLDPQVAARWGLNASVMVAGGGGDKANAPFFLPYLSGERTPHNDPDARGIFWGMTHASLRAQLGYAVLEGVSFGINDGLQALKESGTPIAQCSLVGGGARSPFWAQLLADILAMPVVTHKGGETGGALGAARLACLAAGKPIAAVCEKPEVWQTWRAEPIRHHILMQRYAQFKALYLNDLHYRQH
ncbi:TPA: xylulokinase [Klebsiella pneumoniae]|nr:xylulokinase [Klebsiella pneumoniae]